MRFWNFFVNILGGRAQAFSAAGHGRARGSPLLSWLKYFGYHLDNERDRSSVRWPILVVALVSGSFYQPYLFLRFISYVSTYFIHCILDCVLYSALVTNRLCLESLYGDERIQPAIAINFCIGRSPRGVLYPEERAVQESLGASAISDGRRRWVLE